MESYGILSEYDNILLGKKKVFTSSYFEYSDTINTATALSVFKYAMEYYLEWSPQDIYDKLNMDIIKLMHLEYAFSKITFPDELDKKKDLWYIACKLYPNYFKFKEEDLSIIIYEKILNGEAARFPTNYFSGVLGINRACECLQHMMINYMSILFYKVQDIYYFFSTEIGINYLKKYKLLKSCQEFYDNPVEFAHDSLSSVQQNEIFEHFYSFKWEFSNHLKNNIRNISNEIVDENLTDKEKEIELKSLAKFANQIVVK